MNNLHKYKIVYSDDDFTIADLGYGYLVYVATNILIKGSSKLKRDLNVVLDLKYGFYQSMPCTRIVNGGFGENLLVFHIIYNGIIILNENVNPNFINTDLYTIPCTFFVPKA